MLGVVLVVSVLLVAKFTTASTTPIITKIEVSMLNPSLNENFAYIIVSTDKPTFTTLYYGLNAITVASTTIGTTTVNTVTGYEFKQDYDTPGYYSLVSFLIRNLKTDATYHVLAASREADGSISYSKDSTFLVQVFPDIILASIRVGPVSLIGKFVKYYASWSTVTNCGGKAYYGLTSSYGSVASVTDLTDLSGFGHQAVFSNLSRGTTYHYKLNCTNQLGTSESPDATFTTATRK